MKTLLLIIVATVVCNAQLGDPSFVASLTVPVTAPPSTTFTQTFEYSLYGIGIASDLIDWSENSVYSQPLMGLIEQ